MRLELKCLAAIAGLLLGVGPTQAAHTHARLVMSAESAKPGETVFAGFVLRMDQGWHTYWQNPGGSGMATTFEWKLPPGITAGKPQWPIPEKLPDKDFTTYIYRDEVLVLVPLTITAGAAAGVADLKATVSWLECDVQCVPGRADVTASLKIGSESKASADAALITSWQSRLPKESTVVAARAWWEKGPSTDERPIIFEWTASTNTSGADFYPDANDAFEVAPQVEQLPGQAGKIRIRKEIKKVSGDWPVQVSGIFVQGIGMNRAAYQVDLKIEAMGVEAVRNGPATGDLASVSATPALWKMLIYAFIGGLILNVMPCVLPVIALKILGFVGQAKDNPRRARFLGLVYAAGVLVSFLALAGIVLGVKAAGHRAGWGIQFSSPYFLVAMTTLVTLIALNLFGVFEVTLGSRTMDAAANLSSKEGAAGAFFNGLLATLLATSCTAPFLGAAVGFAFAPSQSATTTLSVFLFVGLGLAFPYVLLAWEPRWLKILPKPGAWMERFKVAMGFPMLAAAVWLFSLVNIYYGDRSFWLALFLVTVALAAWIYGEFLQRHRARPALALIAMAAVLFFGYAYALEGHLRWREPLSQDQPAKHRAKKKGGLPWEDWSLAAVAQGQAEHRPVLVDFTADWCLTCKTVVEPALDSAAVREKVKQINALALQGDYTRYSDDITEELGRHNRAGVPLVLVYPPQPGKQPSVLPEALTPGMVVNALERVANVNSLSQVQNKE